MPNSVVKRNSADGSVGSPHVRVGHRQALFAVCLLKLDAFDSCDAHVRLHTARLASKSSSHSDKLLNKAVIDKTLFREKYLSGAVVQLVRIPACHAGGRGFESRPLRHLFKTSAAMLGFFRIWR